MINVDGSGEFGTVNPPTDIEITYPELILFVKVNSIPPPFAVQVPTYPVAVAPHYPAVVASTAQTIPV